jgi:phospholipase C
VTERIAPFNAKLSRRRFIGTGAALAAAAGLAGYLPEGLVRAVAATAPATPFNLSQVKHVVFLMQENRSFDHYFGTYPGVRGFSDPTAIRLANGNSVFQQPDPANLDGYVEPFHISTVTSGAAAVPSLSHDWRDQHASWNLGAMDGFVRTHTASDGVAHGTYTMGYYTQEDIPFHWALAQNFMLLDNYHCSTMSMTYPNRLYWQAGMLDPQGQFGGPVLETATPNPLTWTTTAEALYNAGYGVKVYASDTGDGLNAFAFFKNFLSSTILAPGLYNNIMSNSTVWGSSNPSAAGAPTSPMAAVTAGLAFEEDCQNGTLPDVSWIMPDDGNVDEHPPFLPADGAAFIASKLEALAANEDLWNTTVFILNYDENDGFFDHVTPPTPDPTTYPDEFVDIPSPKGTPGGGLPLGAGFRVPCFIISPWTIGGTPYSAVSDHTSCLQFLEAIVAAGGLSGQGTEVNFTVDGTATGTKSISPWRYATFDDFQGAFAPAANSAAQPAPAGFQAIVNGSADLSNGETLSAYVTSQTAASSLALPPFPGAAQTAPTQDPS